MKFWRENVDRILEFNDKPLLKGKGSVGKEIMEAKVREIYRLFEQKRKTDEARQADLADLEELNLLEDQIKRNNT